MKPSIGRIVHYVLNASDEQSIHLSRRIFQSPGTGVIGGGPGSGGRPIFRGNDPRTGAHVPVMIIVAWDDTKINGQAFLDGTDTLWITSALYSEDPKPGTWHWPERID